MKQSKRRPSGPAIKYVVVDRPRRFDSKRTQFGSLREGYQFQCGCGFTGKLRSSEKLADRVYHPIRNQKCKVEKKDSPLVELVNRILGG